METSRTICQLQAWHNTASLGAEASITSLQPTREFMKQDVTAYMKYYNLERLCFLNRVSEQNSHHCSNIKLHSGFQAYLAQ